jgi:hypothetical protein
MKGHQLRIQTSQAHKRNPSSFGPDPFDFLGTALGWFYAASDSQAEAVFFLHWPPYNAAANINR